MCHIVLIWFLGMNVILSPPIPVKCPRQVIAEELLKKMAPVDTSRAAPRPLDILQPIQKRC